MNHERHSDKVVNLGWQRLVPSSSEGFAAEIVLTGWFSVKENTNSRAIPVFFDARHVLVLLRFPDRNRQKFIL